MLNRETNTDILGIYKKTSEGVLKFSYFGEVRNNTTQIHSLPSAYNYASANSMLLHSGSTGIGTDTTVTEITGVNVPSALTFKQFTTISAIPNYINQTEPYHNSISIDKLTNSTGLYYSLLIKIVNPSALTDSDALFIINPTNNKFRPIQQGSNILSKFVHLGDNVYVLNDISDALSFSTEVQLPIISLVSFVNGIATAEASTTIEYLDACIVVDAKQN